ncbi:hypothetical protein [Saliphagus infecundisoli]|uniref:Integral membrane protein n=1 Tax=Saliphagus infecundisoli TaxID=1849069 RepID=A0ABD5QJW0_9EURY|nr:hypothetical protein [Saliphagus infecundisoli]
MRGLPESIRPDSRGRLIERLCYLLPPTLGVGAVGVLRDAELGVPLLSRGLVLVATFGYTVLSLALAAAVFIDAREVRHVGGWEPRPLLYGAATLLAAPAVAPVYLARRHVGFGTPPDRREWWPLVALSLATTLVGAGLAAVALVLAIPDLFGWAVGIAGAIAVGAFPVAIHRDAAYVSFQHAGWEPNPGLYLGLASLSLFVPVLQPLLAAYYLHRRRRTVGFR